MQLAQQILKAFGKHENKESEELNRKKSKTFKITFSLFPLDIKTILFKIVFWNFI